MINRNGILPCGKARRSRMWMLIATGLGLMGSPARASGQDAKPADDLARSFFARHCQTCHEGAKPKGKFRLESLTQDFSDKANRERWQAALEQVKSDTMPPEERPRPQEAEITALGDFINGRIAAAEAARSPMAIIWNRRSCLT